MFKTHSSAFNNSKFTRWYFGLIEGRLALNRVRTPDELERHHILPKSKSLFPQFASFKLHPWNEVLLTPREHFIAHRLLARCFDLPVQRRAMVYGCHRLAGVSKQLTSRQYEVARKDFLNWNRGETHPSFGLKMSAESRAKMSASSPETKTAEHRANIGKANARRVWTDESRTKASISASEKTLSETHRSNISKVTSGARNPMAGTKWIHDPQTDISKVIKIAELDVWLNHGWVIGQSATLKKSNASRQARRSEQARALHES